MKPSHLHKAEFAQMPIGVNLCRVVFEEKAFQVDRMNGALRPPTQLNVNSPVTALCIQIHFHI